MINKKLPLLAQERKEVIDTNIKELSEFIEGLSAEDAKEFVRKLLLENRKCKLEIEFINHSGSSQ